VVMTLAAVVAVAVDDDDDEDEDEPANAVRKDVLPLPEGPNIPQTCPLGMYPLHLCTIVLLLLLLLLSLLLLSDNKGDVVMMISCQHKPPSPALKVSPSSLDE
jgi:hypothetical protein